MQPTQLHPRHPRQAPVRRAGPRVDEARREWIERQGRSAFMEVTVPETGVRLAQAAGRLLRTDQDYGTVTILDRPTGHLALGAVALARPAAFPLEHRRHAAQRRVRSEDLKTGLHARCW